MEIRIAGTENDSIVDGPGFRFTIFTQGCPHNCPGCHNPQTHDFNGGNVVDTDELFQKILANPLLDGVTFSGGEPFCQAASLCDLGKRIKEHGLDIITYTGFTWEYLIENADANVSDSENQPMPFLHDLESEYEPFPSEEGWQHDNLILPHEESDQTQTAPTPRREFLEGEEESIAETSAHDTTVDTLIKNPSIDLDTSAIQSIEGDTLHLQNKEHKSSGNRAGHKQKDTLSATATEPRSHAHRKKASQGAASQPAKPLNNDNKEQSRTPRPEPQTDGIQTTES